MSNEITGYYNEFAHFKYEKVIDDFKKTSKHYIDYIFLNSYEDDVWVRKSYALDSIAYKKFNNYIERFSNVPIDTLQEKLESFGSVLHNYFDEELGKLFPAVRIGDMRTGQAIALFCYMHGRMQDINDLNPAVLYSDGFHYISGHSFDRAGNGKVADSKDIQKLNLIVAAHS